jgi:hypothetical protein
MANPATEKSTYDVRAFRRTARQITYFDNAWRILRWNDEWHGNWTGSYPTADAALDRLRNELKLLRKTDLLAVTSTHNFNRTRSA